MNCQRVFIHYLKQVKCLLGIIQDHDNVSERLLLKRVSDDMLPLSSQVQICANFSLRACCQLAGKEVVSFDNNICGYKGLFRQLDETLDYLKHLPQSPHAPDAIGVDKAGFADIQLPIADYIALFALPNFFFHVSMLYAIARQNAIPVSKGDFDGMHVYPSGFSWENTN